MTPDPQPTRDLLLALLTDAVNVIAHHRRSDRAATPKDLTDAMQWIMADDVISPFSFLNVCDALDLDPTRLRARMWIHWGAQPVRFRQPQGLAS
jgi:hypothetical protein